MAANVMGLGVVAAIADGVASSMVTVDELAALLSPAVAVESSTGLVHGTLGSLSFSDRLLWLVHTRPCYIVACYKVQSRKQFCTKLRLLASAGEDKPLDVGLKTMHRHINRPTVVVAASG